MSEDTRALTAAEMSCVEAAYQASIREVRRPTDCSKCNAEIRAQLQERKRRAEIERQLFAAADALQRLLKNTPVVCHCDCEVCKARTFAKETLASIHMKPIESA